MNFEKIVFLAFLFYFTAIAGQVLASGENRVGNEISSRSNIDASAAFTFIDTNNPTDYDGNLTSFQYYAANTRPFYFVIVNSGNVVKWVSSQITPPATGPQTYAATVNVEDGWYLGAYFPATSSIPFTDGGESARYTSSATSQPVVGDTLTVSTASRTYSIAAVGNATATKPSTPKIIVPANNSTTTVGAFTVEWEAATGTEPITYQLQGFKDNLYEIATYSSAWTSNLETTVPNRGAGVYYLRVQAKDNNGNLGDWSNGVNNRYKITLGAAKSSDSDSTATTTMSISDVLAKKAACMKSNWADSNLGLFKNQGQCVSHYNQLILGHVENLIKTIKAKMVEMAGAVKKQNEYAVSQGYKNYGEYKKAQLQKDNNGKAKENNKNK